MKTLFVAISDIHVSIKNLDVSRAVLKQALDKARELSVPLFISGDLNDGKAVMRSEWVKMLIDLFHEYDDVTIEVLVGNHDLDNKNSENNSLYFLKTLSNVTLWDKPATVMLNGDLWGIIPYQTSVENMKKEVSFMRTNDVKRLIIHQGILSAYMGEYVVDESSISPEEFSGFEIVLSGHYHRSQRVGENIMYFGSPFTVSFGEANEEKFIWIVDEVEGKIVPRPVMTNARRHIQLLIEQETYNQTQKLNIIPEGSLLKVVVRGTKEWVKQFTTEYFQAAFPQASSVSVDPDIVKQSGNRISAEIIRSPLKVVDTYLNQCQTLFNKDELRTYLLNNFAGVFERFTSSTSKRFKIVGVEAENFLSFKGLKFEYTPMGLTLIEGYDEDLGVNTGAGKSSFLDAPVYGIFGETSKNLKADEVINRQVGRNLMVKTFLQADDGLYSINRYRKHNEKDNDLFMVLPNGQQVRGKDNRETQKLIEQTIGCSFDVFLKSSYFTQFGAIDRFLSATDTKQKELISEITDLSIYDDLHEAVKKKIAADEKELDSYKIQSDKIQSNINILKNQRVSLEETSKKWEQKRLADIDDLTNISICFEQNKKVEIQDLKNKSARWEQEKLCNIQSLELKGQKYWEEIEEKKRKLSDQIHFNNGEIAGLEFQIQELQAFPIIDVADEKKKIQEKLCIIQQLEIQVGKLQTEVQHNNFSWNKIKEKIDIELKKKEQNLGTECSFCHQPVSSSHIDQHIAGLMMEQNELNGKVDQLQVKIESINGTIAIKPSLQDQLKNLDAKEKHQFEIKYKIDSLQRSIKNLQDTNGRLQSDIDQKHEDIYGPQVASAKALVNPFDGQITVTEMKINTYAEQLVKLKEQQNPHSSGILDIELKIQGLIKDAEGIDGQSKIIQHSLDLGKWWKTAIHVYIKSYLMDSCLESVNTIANEYLNTLFDGVLKFNISATTEKGSEVKEKISVTIINNGDECSYQSLSGGERCRICLAVNLALAEVISNSAGKSFNMIFLDEILTGLDEVGKAQSMKLLKELERKFDSVFVIDHAEQFKSLFSNSLMVKKKNKTSSIV